MRRAIKRFDCCGLFFLMCFTFSVATASVGFASTILLQWDPNTEADLAGYKVYYKANFAVGPFDGAGAVEGVAPIDVAKQTTATINGLDPGTDYYFAVTAYNTSGMESSYSDIVKIPAVQDLSAPTVSLSSPYAGATLTGTVAVTATATDDLGVSRIELYGNGQLLVAGNVSPMSYSLDTTSLPNGSYTLVAKAYDAAGNVGEGGSVTVNILNDAAAPTINFLAPTTTYIYTPTVNVSASAIDNVGISKMEIYIDGVLRTTTTSASIALPVSMTKGLHSILVKAFDSSNNLATKAMTVQRIF